MEPVTQSLAQGKAGANRAPPNESVGALGKFGTFWMPKSTEEISQRTGADHGRPPDGKDKVSQDKLARQKTNSQTTFRDLIRQKEGSRASKPQHPSEKPAASSSKPADPKAIRQQQLPHSVARPAAKLPAAPASTANAKTLSPERAAADRPTVPTSTKKDMQESLKQIKEQKDRDMDHRQDADRESGRDHGAENAKHEQAPQSQIDLQETAKPEMNSSSRAVQKTQSLGLCDAESRSGSIDASSSTELSSGIPAGRFLRSDEKSQRDSRHVFTQVRRRIGGFMDGESRMARIAIDLPGGGRLGIKMRFVGDQLEVIFATEDPALRAALLEDWRRLARAMGDGGSRLLPPAFAQENYEGIVRGKWNEAA